MNVVLIVILTLFSVLGSIDLPLLLVCLRSYVDDDSAGKWTWDMYFAVWRRELAGLHAEDSPCM